MLRSTLAAAIALTLPALALGHGDVTPQAVDTKALPELGKEWREENPYRAAKAGKKVWETAVKIGASGYNQNCARCHGLEVVSGGLAPDLRFIEADADGDEWFIERFRKGYTQNGITKMPAFGKLLGQKAAWAIRTYIETRPDDGALDKHAKTLAAIRDDLAKKAAALAGGARYTDMKAEVEAHQAAMTRMVGTIATGSGAPVADSPVSRALSALDGTALGVKAAADALTIGLSAAK